MIFLTEISQKMKLSTTIVLLFIASYAFAQNSNRASHSTKIDENEKKRLENQFKALNTFYINDDGLVVYQTQGNHSASEDKTEEHTDTINETATPSEQVKAEDSNENYPIKNENKKTVNTYTEEPLSRQNTSITESTETKAVAPEKTYVRSNIIKKAALTPAETEANKDNANIPTEIVREPVTIINSPISTVDEGPKSTLVTTDSKETNQKEKTSKKSSVFDKKKRPSQYKTMEEAALAVEALLDDLRKEQAQTTSAGSMSSRLSGGAGKATLRKKAATAPSFSTANSYNNITAAKTSDFIDDENSEFGIEPTYYINGKEVSKVEINRLRKKEIINKEVRTRNTVSRNPNGEVWYEVKYDN